MIVGLTGGIGSGKSTVASLFAKHGAGIIDTDTIAHLLTQTGGGAMPAIQSAFGNDYINADGALNRAKMRALIFTDTAAKQQLEIILHPLIYAQAKAQLQQMQMMPYLILVVPLLPESPAFQQIVQRVLVVDCEAQLQIERVIARSRMTEAEVRTIMTQQTPRAERIAMADDIIHNESSLDNLASQVAVLHARYSKRNVSNK